MHKDTRSSVNDKTREEKGLEDLLLALEDDSDDDDGRRGSSTQSVWYKNSEMSLKLPSTSKAKIMVIESENIK